MATNRFSRAFFSTMKNFNLLNDQRIVVEKEEGEEEIQFAFATSKQREWSYEDLGQRRYCAHERKASGNAPSALYVPATSLANSSAELLITKPEPLEQVEQVHCTPDPDRLALFGLQ